MSGGWRHPHWPLQNQHSDGYQVTLNGAIEFEEQIVVNINSNKGNNNEEVCSDITGEIKSGIRVAKGPQSKKQNKTPEHSRVWMSQ